MEDMECVNKKQEMHHLIAITPDMPDFVQVGEYDKLLFMEVYMVKNHITGKYEKCVHVCGYCQKDVKGAVVEFGRFLISAEDVKEKGLSASVQEKQNKIEQKKMELPENADLYEMAEVFFNRELPIYWCSSEQNHDFIDCELPFGSYAVLEDAS